MGIIKSAHAPSSLRPFSLADIENAARSMLLKARLQAEELLAAAQREGDTLKAAAHAQGLAQGLADGLADGRATGHEAGRREAFDVHRIELVEALAALKSVLSAIDFSRRELEAGALGEVISLAAAIARKVTKRQGLVDEQVLLANLSQAMQLAVGASDIRVAINSFQAKTLRDSLPQLQMDWPDLKHVEIVEDPAIAPGGCRIFTGGGSIDADLDAQLERIVAALLPCDEPLGHEAEQ